MKKTARVFTIVVAALLLQLAQATVGQASSFTLDLNGAVSDASTSSFEWNSMQYDRWDLTLTGMTPITVRTGDTINVTVTLDQSHTIPAEPADGATTAFLLYLGGSNSPNMDTSVTSTTTFFNLGATVTSQDSGTGTNGMLAGGYLLNPGAPSITFDKVTFEWTVTKLGDSTGNSLDLSTAFIQYDIATPISSSPVPIPGAVWLFGSGLAGLMRLRRKRFE